MSRGVFTMINKFQTKKFLFSCITLGICCCSFASIDQQKKEIETTTEQNSNDNIIQNELNTNDYESLLEPYQKQFIEFNNLHGTSYGFMTDEQLRLHNMDKQEYLKNISSVYTNMSLDEFNDYLEKIYDNALALNNGNVTPEILPYFEPDLSNDIIEIEVSSNAT